MGDHHVGSELVKLPQLIVEHMKAKEATLHAGRMSRFRGLRQDEPDDIGFAQVFPGFPVMSIVAATHDHALAIGIDISARPAAAIITPMPMAPVMAPTMAPAVTMGRGCRRGEGGGRQGRSDEDDHGGSARRIAEKLSNPQVAGKSAELISLRGQEPRMEDAKLI